MYIILVGKKNVFKVEKVNTGHLIELSEAKRCWFCMKIKVYFAKWAEMGENHIMPLSKLLRSL